MESRRSTVRFAGKVSEDDYIQLASSEHPEDKRLYSVLAELREAVDRGQTKGERISDGKIPSAYKQMFQIKNLWCLRHKSGAIVFYSLRGNEIWIVDLV